MNQIAAEETFEGWLARTCTPPENYSFAQYGRYLEGWRQSKPWAFKGMSLAYDAWAETRWSDCPSLERLRDGWNDGLAIRAKSIFGGEPSWGRKSSMEECSDFALSLPETFEALAGMAVDVLAAQHPELFSEIR